MRVHTTNRRLFSHNHLVLKSRSDILSTLYLTKQSAWNSSGKAKLLQQLWSRRSPGSVFLETDEENRVIHHPLYSALFNTSVYAYWAAGTGQRKQQDCSWGVTIVTSSFRYPFPFRGSLIIIIQKKVSISLAIFTIRIHGNLQSKTFVLLKAFHADKIYLKIPSMHIRKKKNGYNHKSILKLIIFQTKFLQESKYTF